jgi:hypothetical protein
MADCLPPCSCFGGLVASVLALGAVVPAWRGNRVRTIALAAPALVVVLLVTIWTGYEYLTDGLRDPDLSIDDFVAPWLFLAGPSFAASLLAISVLLLRKRAGDG